LALVTLPGCQTVIDFFFPPKPATGHILPDSLMAFCARQHWDSICTVPEYTDDQRLNAGHGEYGPKVFGIPADGLAQRVSAASFNSVGAAVGAVFVDTTAGTPLPAPYQDLNLAAGVNCVYLRFNPPTADFVGYVVPPLPPPAVPCPDNGATGGALPVIAVSSPGFNSSNAVPAVLRFHEGNRHVNARPQALIGIKCAERWCMLAPAQTDTVPLPHQGLNPGQMTWAVHGWSDAQHLGVNTGPGTPIRLSPDLEASIVPGVATTFTGIGNFENQMVHLATVHFNVNVPPNSKYGLHWGFKIGDNQIWVRKNGSDWVGEVRNYGPSMGCTPTSPCVHPVVIERTDHNGVYPPATARFRWDENDEGLWARCDDGCCKVSGT
jgi:hypothetical protein